LIFLVGTSEMQVIANTTTIGSQKENSPMLTALENIKSVGATFKNAFSQYQAKYDKDGNIDTIIHYLVPEMSRGKLGEQVLLQDLSDADMVNLGNKCFVIAAVILIIATLTLNIPVDKFAGMSSEKTPADQVRSNKITEYGGLAKFYVANFCFLISAAIWFQGFYYYTQVTLDAGGDIRSMGPLIMKLLASALFTIQPMTSLLRMPTEVKNTKKGIYWANFYAIILFHIGNMISTSITLKNASIFDMLNPSNQPMLAATLCFMLGTTFLLAGDGTTIAQLGGEKSYPKGLAIAYPLIGEAFLLVGSIILMVNPSN